MSSISIGHICNLPGSAANRRRAYGACDVCGSSGVRAGSAGPVDDRSVATSHDRGAGERPSESAGIPRPYEQAAPGRRKQGTTLADASSAQPLAICRTWSWMSRRRAGGRLHGSHHRDRRCRRSRRRDRRSFRDAGQSRSARFRPFVTRADEHHLGDGKERSDVFDDRAAGDAACSRATCSSRTTRSFDWQFVSHRDDARIRQPADGPEDCARCALRESLLPQLPRRSLDYLADYYGVEITSTASRRRRRTRDGALPDSLLDDRRTAAATRGEDLDTAGRRHSEKEKATRRTRASNFSHGDTTA